METSSSSTKTKQLQSKRAFVADAGGDRANSAGKHRCRANARQFKESTSAAAAAAASAAFRDLARRACRLARAGGAMRQCAVVLLERRRPQNAQASADDADEFQWQMSVEGSEPLRSHLRLLAPEVTAWTSESLLATAAASASALGSSSPCVSLPELIVEGEQVRLEEMPVGQLRRFVPEMLKLSTGRGQLLWDNLAAKPQWWPDHLLPWRNVKQDWRTNEQRNRVSSHAEALREVVRRCYRFHCQSHLLELPLLAVPDAVQLEPETDAEAGFISDQQPEVAPIESKRKSGVESADLLPGALADELHELEKQPKMLQEPVRRSLGTQTDNETLEDQTVQPPLPPPPPPPPPTTQLPAPQLRQPSLWIRAPTNLSLPAPAVSRYTIVRIESRPATVSVQQQPQPTPQRPPRLATSSSSDLLIGDHRRVTDVSQLQDDQPSPLVDCQSAQRSSAETAVQLPVLIRRGQIARLAEYDVDSIRRLLLRLVRLWNDRGGGGEDSDIGGRRRRCRRIRWGCNDQRPAWWPLDVLPFLSIQEDRRTERERGDLGYTSALREAVRACYQYYGQEHLIN